MSNEIDTGDRIGQLADTVENLIAAEEIPFPPQLAKDARIASLTGLRDDLRAIAVELLGHNPWED